MYRLPLNGTPRTAGSGKSNRQERTRKKGGSAGRLAKGAADNRRPTTREASGKCRNERLLQLEQPLHFACYLVFGPGTQPECKRERSFVPQKYTCQPEGFAVVSELPIKAADAGHPDMGRASSPPS